MADLSKETPQIAAIELATAIIHAAKGDPAQAISEAHAEWAKYDGAIRTQALVPYRALLRKVASLYANFPDKRPSDGEVMEVIDEVREVVGDV